MTQTARDLRPGRGTGLDRSYGVTLPPEEVAKLIEARGGHPPRPQDEPRG